MKKVTNKNALEFYVNILKEVDVRVGRNPDVKRSFSKAASQQIIKEYTRVLNMPAELAHKYKMSRISSLLCKEFDSLGVF